MRQDIFLLLANFTSEHVSVAYEITISPLRLSDSQNLVREACVFLLACLS